jgi:transcriptional antiterminator NusG
MDLPESQEQFEQEPTDKLAEEQSAPVDVVVSHPSTGSGLRQKPVARSEPQIPTDLPLIEATVEGPAWYVIHCYSGYENKVRHNLEQRIETMGMKDMIFDVVIPTQEEIEVKDGKRRTVERHIFPGYVLVNLALSEESWYVVRNTPGVTGFVGMGNNPTPLRPEEVAQIVKRMEAEAPTVKVSFKVGERVRIVDGPFNDFRGTVAEIDMERTKVRVMVSFFGRETPVELDFLQVEKA